VTFPADPTVASQDSEVRQKWVKGEILPGSAWAGGPMSHKHMPQITIRKIHKLQPQRPHSGPGDATEAQFSKSLLRGNRRCNRHAIAIVSSKMHGPHLFPLP